MHKQIMVYLYNRILLINQKEKGILINATAWINLRTIMVSERTHIKKREREREYPIWFYMYKILENAN